MELQREPDPQPAPPEPTGAVVEKKKLKVIILLAVAIGLVIASFFTWLFRPRAVMEQRPMPLGSTANATPKSIPKLNEQAELDAERKTRDTRSNPAFNLNTGEIRDTNREPIQAVAAVQKRTPEDDYKDLLQKAALADSSVGGGQVQHSSDANRISSTGSTLPSDTLSNLPGNTQTDKKGLVEIPRNSLPAGTFIYCALVNELNGENAGPVKVQASNDVYFPDTFEVAIPQGSIFLGETQRVSSQFQGRLAVTFDRLQTRRDGKLYEIKLDKIPGLDQQGATALKDKVDSHYRQIFGVSLAIGAIGGLAQIGNGGNYGGYGGIDTETQVRNGISQTMAQNATQILNRFLNRMPTVIVRSGTPVVVFIPFGIELE
jgi:type IV secretory pathway VirB10-like protein